MPEPVGLSPPFPNPFKCKVSDHRQLRASNNKCDEKYIRVIARELAIALQSIHEASVIHRDLKGT